MPRMKGWMRLIILVALVVTGVAIARNVTQALRDAFYGGAPVETMSR